MLSAAISGMLGVFLVASMVGALLAVRGVNAPKRLKAAVLGAYAGGLLVLAPAALLMMAIAIAVPATLLILAAPLVPGLLVGLEAGEVGAPTPA